jgi:hypothetical protein
MGGCIEVEAKTRLTGDKVTYCSRSWGEILTPGVNDIECTVTKEAYLAKWPTKEGSPLLCHFGSSNSRFSCEATSPPHFNLQGTGSGTLKVSFIMYKPDAPVRTRTDIVVDVVGSTEEKLILFCPMSLDQLKNLDNKSKFECLANRQEFLRTSPTASAIVFGCFRDYQDQDSGQTYTGTYGCAPYELIEKR